MRSNKTLLYFRKYIKNTPGLSGKESFVLLKRLRSKTLSSIGLKYNVSEARIRQIERSAIRKIISKIKQPSLFKLNKKNVKLPS